MGQIVFVIIDSCGMVMVVSLFIARPSCSLFRSI